MNQVKRTARKYNERNFSDGSFLADEFRDSEILPELSEDEKKTFLFQAGIVLMLVGTLGAIAVYFILFLS